MVKFGLAKGKLKSKTTLTTSSAFGGADDDDDDDGNVVDAKAGKAQVNTDLVRSSTQATQQVKTRIEYQKALQEDATVFEYDEIYDDVKSKKEPEKEMRKPVSQPASGDGSGLVVAAGGTKTARKSKYVEKLLAGSAARKLEQDRRNERILKRERDDEGDDFDDKEVFVTESYKQTLKEFRRLDEEDKQREEAEASRAVGGAGNMMNFYGNLLDSQTFGGSKKPSASARKDQGPSSTSTIADGKRGAETTDDRVDDPRSAAAVPEVNQEAFGGVGESGIDEETVADVHEPRGERTTMAVPTAAEASPAVDHAKVRRNKASDVEAKRAAYLERKKRKMEAQGA